ncbi:C-type lectin domain family 12 member B, partial [Chaetura pelagica]
VYADLRFAKVMGGRSMANQALEAALGMDEAESPYENTQPELAGEDGDGAQPSPGHWTRWWCIPVGLMATCLLLLVATVAVLPAPSPCLCTACHCLPSPSHCIPLLSRCLSLPSLALSFALSPLALSLPSTCPTRTLPSPSLCFLLSRSLPIASYCLSIAFTSWGSHPSAGAVPWHQHWVFWLCDCCPSGWLLYRGKCLFISSEKKTWENSREECERKYSQLLVTKSWSRWTVPAFLKNADTPYWIGLQKNSFPWYAYDWLEEGYPDGDGVPDAWFWVDGSLYERPWQWKSNGSCAIISRGNIKPALCAGPEDLHLWICEKAAGPSSP